jgi:hypothetical protein
MSSNSFKIKNSAVLTPKDLTELVNPESGELVCDINDNNKIKRYDANIPGWVEVGSGAGGINYIDNPDFEGNTNGWFTYADAAGVAPVDGTGGTSALTISRSTSSPLRGTASLNIAKPASNAQGSGVSVDFSIDPADQTKLVDISFDFSASANYADGDFRVYIVSKTVGTVIELVQRDLFASNNGTYTGRFQALPNDTEYRLVLHCAVTSTLAFDVKIDNVQVGPSAPRVKGPVVTDPIAVTATLTNAGNATVTASYIRLGSEAKIEGRITIGSTLPTGVIAVAVPSLLPTYTQNLLIKTSSGKAIKVESGSTFLGAIRWDNTNKRYDFLGGNGQQFWTGAVPFTFAAGDAIDFSITVPILGWSSNLVLSEDAGMIPTDLIVRGLTSAQSIPHSTQTKIINWTAASVDSLASFNPSTGEYTFKRKAKIFASAAIEMTGSTNGVVVAYLRKNNVEEFAGPAFSTSAGLRASVSGAIDVNKDDTLSVFALQTSGGSLNTTVSAARNYFGIIEQTSPQTIASGETVAVNATTTSGQSIPNATTTVITWGTKTLDTHNSLNTSDGNITIPVTGRYAISFSALTASVAWTAGNVYQLLLSVGGTNVKRMFIAAPYTGTYRLGLDISHEISLVKGDIVAAQVYHERGSATALNSGTTWNTISLTRIAD